jgi:hypothetical protein
MVTLKITIKDAERKKLIEEYVIDRLIDKDITMTNEDETINKYLKKLLAEFKAEPEHIIVTATMVIM